MNCTHFRFTAVLAALLAATACAEQEPEAMAEPTPAAMEQGDESAPAPLPSMPAEPAEQGVDQATPESVPDPGNAGRPTASPPTQSMPVPEELYPVDPAPVPPPER